MSNDPNKTDQQERGEELLKAIQDLNGGELVEDATGRLRLVHPLTVPPAST